MCEKNKQKIDESVVDSITTELQGYGIDNSDLDEVVHDLYSNIASDVNNRGMEGQIRDILEQNGIESGIKILNGSFDVNLSLPARL